MYESNGFRDIVQELAGGVFKLSYSSFHTKHCGTHLT